MAVAAEGRQASHVNVTRSSASLGRSGTIVASLITSHRQTSRPRCNSLAVVLQLSALQPLTFGCDDDFRHNRMPLGCAYSDASIPVMCLLL